MSTKPQSPAPGRLSWATGTHAWVSLPLQPMCTSWYPTGRLPGATSWHHEFCAEGRGAKGVAGAQFVLAKHFLNGTFGYHKMSQGPFQVACRASL